MVARIWRPFLALLLGLALALGADQIIARLLPSPSHEDRPWYLQTVQYHPVLGWSGYPNFAGTRDGRPVRTNALGYRDRAPVEADDDRKPRVLFLGDSFTWADEVALEDRFTSLLEASCGSQCDRLPAIRAINRGVIGYGTAQSFLDYLLVRERRPLQAVILALYTGNDLTDNATVASASGPRPRLIRCERESARDGLCLEGVPVPPVLDWPEHRLISPRGWVSRTFGWSGLISMASERRAPRFLIDKRIASQADGLLKAVPFPIVERQSNDPIEDQIGQLEAILRALDRTVRAGGPAFGVMVFPSARVYDGTAAGELRNYREIVQMLARLHIPSVDYYEATKDFHMDDLYFGSEGHWRPSGHQEAAKLLRPLLVSLVP
jgi:hypothetical protein